MPPSRCDSSVSKAGILAATLWLVGCPLAGGGDGGSTGSTGNVVAIADAGPPTAVQLCQRLWAGQQRYQLLSTFSALTQTAPGCPSPDAHQQAALAAQVQAQAAQLLTLAPPDGGWPASSGPSVCNDPSSAFGGLPAQIANSLSSGRALWSFSDDQSCASGMTVSANLTALLLANGGSFAGQAQTVGPLSRPAGPCLNILQGLVAAGGSCVNAFDCTTGHFCRSVGGTGSSCPAGICTALVTEGGPCGPLDACAQGLTCLNGVCNPIAQGGPVGTACSSALQCQSCLVCVDGGCALPGAEGAACAHDTDCGLPYLYCNGGTCQPSALIGEDCTTSDPLSCLQGWCSATEVCLPLSTVGGPCTSAASCVAGLLCSAASICQAPPDAGLPTQGLSCDLSVGCAGADIICYSQSLTCTTPLPGNLACGQDSDCQSGSCVAADGGLVCASPCAMNPALGNGGCQNQELSFILGLGGALALFDRRRRRRP